MEANEVTAEAKAAYTQATNCFDLMHDAHDKVEAAKAALRAAIVAAEQFSQSLQALPNDQNRDEAVAEAAMTVLDLASVGTALYDIEVIK